uniref:Uncharacterized protein n=1 Tax=Clastoptera arizonana TaxID=38151 RepID=A0A1B6DSQ8_9HEMI
MFSEYLISFLMLFLTVKLCLSENKTDEHLYAHEFSYGINGGTSPQDLDDYILSVYDNPNIIERDKLIENIRLYVLTLKRYIRLIKKGDEETIKLVKTFFEEGGPKFVKTHRSFSSKEVIFKDDLKFPDFDFQHYQYLRIDAESAVNKINKLLNLTSETTRMG